jgi:predicted peptidase
MPSIDQIIKKYPNIDKNRIYITGLSSGGHGCWEAISKNPWLFEHELTQE